MNIATIGILLSLLIGSGQGVPAFSATDAAGTDLPAVALGDLGAERPEGA